MKGILTIDWDFFIDSDLQNRNILFPSPDIDFLSDWKTLKKEWDRKYTVPKSQLYDVGLNGMYYTFLRHLEEINKRHSKITGLFISEGHEYIVDTFDTFVSKFGHPPDIIVNMDFHHDFYDFPMDSSKDFDCSTWAYYLKLKHPEVRYLWCRNSSSDVRNLTFPNSIFDCENTSPISFPEVCSYLNQGIFPYIHVCRSDLWSPPHLDPGFSKLISLLYNLLWSHKSFVSTCLYPSSTPNFMHPREYPKIKE